MANLEKSFEKELINNTPEMNSLNINTLVSSTQPPEFIIKLFILQKREDLHSALDSYFKARCLGQNADSSKLRARILSLFIQIRSSLKNYYFIKKMDSDFESMEKRILGVKDFDSLYKIISDLEEFLYIKKVIKFDNDLIYDSTRVDVEDKIKGH